ncbi:MAG: 3-dehydroquinate synthase, partial [Candidatus Omnitrophica bacterium]|nr:3-dehydroquinate synthase [Candidatus Omnitrophota bacterium]
MKTTTVHLGERSYPILIGTGLLSQTGELLRRRIHLNADNAVIITTAKIRRLFGGTLSRSLEQVRITPHFITVPDTEKSKSLIQYSKIMNQLTRFSRGGRPFLLLNLGGGVVGDLGGFAAATFKRGIPYVQIPTTLLAQVDSAIGGKTGIDLAVAKNMVGAVWQPAAVISDVGTLRTLPSREFFAGMAEVIKYGVIADKKLIRFLERTGSRELQRDEKTLRYIVSVCARWKAKFVEQDERDKTGKRALLNFGHTVGHAVESAAGYSNRYKHGEAISIGMVCAAKIGVSLGLTRQELVTRLSL